jgi:hypothetical protein
LGKQGEREERVMLISFDGDWVDPRRITRISYCGISKMMTVYLNCQLDDNFSSYVIEDVTQEYADEKAIQVNDALKHLSIAEPR